MKLLPILEAAATEIDPAESGLVALDWLNGRRTPDANQALSGALMGLKLGTDAPAIYRALIEAAAFGSRAIVERLRSEGVNVERVAAVGGVAQKSPLVMLSEGLQVVPVVDEEAAYIGSVQTSQILRRILEITKRADEVKWVNVVGDASFENTKNSFSSELFHNTRNQLQAILSAVDM